ncbi:hypothetical protein CURTO8I2_60163 [Curtobacterium sp. 8I-2]|nr:hypothetical protein CURTO8I2_60163 [Curtobacterium sp. 8I-2]
MLLIGIGSRRRYLKMGYRAETIWRRLFKLALIYQRFQKVTCAHR